MSDKTLRAVDWNDFRYFLAVARAQHLAGAARALGVEHTTVARRLAALESALGVRLFIKTPSGYVLTEVGAELLPPAEDAERALEGACRRALGGDQKVDGRVRLATSESFSPFLVRRLPRLRQSHPALIVEVLTGNRPLDLARGEADVAVRHMRTEQPELVAKKLGVVGWSVYAAKDYLARRPVTRLITASDGLAGHEVVGFSEQLAATPGGVWLGAHTDGASIVLRADSMVSALSAIIAAMGIGSVPCFMADAEPSLVRLTVDPIGSRDSWLVVHPDLARIARVRVVMRFVEELFAEEAALLAGVPCGAGPGAR